MQVNKILCSHYHKYKKGWGDCNRFILIINLLLKCLCAIVTEEMGREADGQGMAPNWHAIILQKATSQKEMNKWSKN